MALQGPHGRRRPLLGVCVGRRGRPALVALVPMPAPRAALARGPPGGVRRDPRDPRHLPHPGRAGTGLGRSTPTGSSPSPSRSTATTGRPAPTGSRAAPRWRPASGSWTNRGKVSTSSPRSRATRVHVRYRVLIRLRGEPAPARYVDAYPRTQRRGAGRRTGWADSRTWARTARRRSSSARSARRCDPGRTRCYP